MTVTAPPRPPRPSDPVDRDELEALVGALIEEARRRAQRRRRRNAAVVTLIALVGGALFAVLGRGAQSQTASSALSARMSAPVQAGTSKIAFTTSPPLNGNDTLGKNWRMTLYVVSPDGSGRRILTRDAWFWAAAWSPDGQRIAFERRIGPITKGQIVGDVDVFVMNADGSGQQNLTHKPAVIDSNPVWSPDGQKLTFGRYRDIWVMNADGSDQRRLTPNREGDRWPAWSPDGQRIAFGSYRASNWDVWVMNAEGSGYRNLTRNRAQDYFPTWSPDGRKIAFVRTRNSWRHRGHPEELWVMNADGSRQRRLVREAWKIPRFFGGQPWLSDVTIGAPRWSPDGRKLLFVSRRDRNPEVYAINADGSRQRRLTHAPGADSDPTWSPDGRKIAFISTRDGEPAIYVMSADGSQQRSITRGIHRIGGFAWSPVQK